MPTLSHEAKKLGDEPAYPNSILGYPSLTKREAFAMANMAGLSACPGCIDGKRNAMLSVQWADDLLEELVKVEEPPQPGSVIPGQL